MSLTLYYHPLSSFCQKALVALYENATPFAGRIVSLMDPAERAEYLRSGRSASSRCSATRRAT